MSNLVSIVMPAYNGGTYIAGAIKSVLAQTHQQWELIIVDDGSTDDTATVVKPYTSADPRVQYIYKPNGGQASALNRGLAAANGDYVTTLDVDDWYTPDSLEARVRFLDEHAEYGAVYGDGYFCNANGEKLQNFSDFWQERAVGDVFDVLLITPFYGTGANVMIRRSILEEHDIRYDESIVWCQDYDIYLRLAQKTRFGLVDAPTVWYRLHDTNMTMTMPKGKRLQSFVKAKSKAIASPRFKTVNLKHKRTFFYQLLMSDLMDNIPEQARFFEMAEFKALPTHAQATLLRQVSLMYLGVGKNSTQIKAWLKQSLELAPGDIKTQVIFILSNLSTQLTQFLVKRWLYIALGDPQKKSIFELAQG